MSNNVFVMLNEQHSLMPEQEKLLHKRFGGVWEKYKIPAEGWTKKEQRNVLRRMTSLWWEEMDYDEDGMAEDTVVALVFASPVPYLYGMWVDHAGRDRNLRTYIFHNDNRDKKELPGGKIIHTVASTGWELLRIN